jgi:HPt (histidine-containing phosphotransfer) domain-containing protein
VKFPEIHFEKGSTLLNEDVDTRIGTQAIDVYTLAALVEIERHGQPEIVGRILGLFLKTAPSLLASLEQASRSAELDELHRATHALKPCSASVGAVSLAAMCGELEGMTRAGSVPDPIARVAAIEQEYKRVEAALQAYLSGRAFGPPEPIEVTF